MLQLQAAAKAFIGLEPYALDSYLNRELALPPINVLVVYFFASWAPEFRRWPVAQSHLTSDGVGILRVARYFLSGV